MSDTAREVVVTMEPLLLRRRDTAGVLGVSESVVLQYESAGLITPIRLPGLRSVRHATTEIKDLAKRIIDGSLRAVPTEDDQQ